MSRVNLLFNGKYNAVFNAAIFTLMFKPSEIPTAFDIMVQPGKHVFCRVAFERGEVAVDGGEHHPVLNMRKGGKFGEEFVEMKYDPIMALVKPILVTAKRVIANITNHILPLAFSFNDCRIRFQLDCEHGIKTIVAIIKPGKIPLAFRFSFQPGNHFWCQLLVSDIVSAVCTWATPFGIIHTNAATD